MQAAGRAPRLARVVELLDMRDEGTVRALRAGHNPAGAHTTDGENQRADSLLIRAKADAELALAQARAKNARVDGQEAADDSAAQRTTNVNQGAEK